MCLAYELLKQSLLEVWIIEVVHELLRRTASYGSHLGAVLAAA